MTNREAAIVSAYTGVLLGSFSEMLKYVEEILECQIWTHDLADKEIQNKIKELSKQDFIAIKITDDKEAKNGN